MSKKLPKFEDYKAPWEVDSDGNDVPEDEQNLDPALLKKKLYDVLSDRQRLVTSRDELTTERDGLQTQLEEIARKSETPDEATQRKIDQAIADAKAEGGLEALKLEVALDIEGITPKQAKRLAKRLTGKTREELAEDAEGLVEDFEIGKTTTTQTSQEEGGEETEENEPTLTARSRPTRLRAAGDPDPSATTLPGTDADAVDKAFPRR